MKVWLTCFGILFVGAELFQWVMQLDSWHFSGAWLVLGGMGLAVASNRTHLPHLSTSDVSEPESAPTPGSGEPGRVIAQDSVEQTSTSAHRAEQASISFRVRSPRL